MSAATVKRALPSFAMTLLALTLLGGCIDIDFPSPHLVQTPRILAIRVDPPEAQFGEDIVFSALVVDEDGTELSGQPNVEMRWELCLSLRAVLSAAGLGGGGLSDNCAEGGSDLIRLETEGLAPNEGRLPGAVVLALAAALPMAGPDMPPPDVPGLDPMLFDTLGVVISEVGVPLRIRFEVWRDGEVLMTGFKRFAITTRAMPTTNPPPPRFAVDGVWLTGRVDGGDPHVCVPEEGVPPRLAPEEQVDVTPDPDEEPWIERYPVFNLGGELTENEESAYYSWFSTAGAFGGDITRRPERDIAFTAPERPGNYPMWLVMRDGHLGLSWCRAEYEVR
ncbi:MAG: hypothetical protein AB8I08_37195 [Sandaracinaceae bacterium]